MGANLTLVNCGMKGASSARPRRPRRGKKDDELDIQRFKELAAKDLDIPPTGRLGRSSTHEQIEERSPDLKVKSTLTGEDSHLGNAGDTTSITNIDGKHGDRGNRKHTELQGVEEYTDLPKAPSLRRSQRIIKSTAKRYVDDTVQPDSTEHSKINPKKAVRKAPAKRKKSIKGNLQPEPAKLKRPGYINKTTGGFAKRTQRPVWAPPLLSKFNNHRRLQDKLVLEKTYPELVELAHQHIPSEANTSALDVAIHHGFLPKNLAFELARFAAVGDVNCSLNQLAGPAFNSSDIDKFFESLDAVDSSLESIKARLKREVPLF